MHSTIIRLRQILSNEPDYVLTIKQPLFSKARPRMTRSGHTYMPDAYKQAQRWMRNQIKEQWSGEPLEGPLLLAVLTQGEGRGDSDNIQGAFMDAAVGIVFKDDRVKIIPTTIFDWTIAPKKRSSWEVMIWDLSQKRYG